MSIVHLNGEKLWVEGEVAYSISEVAAAYEKAVARKGQLESSIEESEVSIKIANDKLSDFKKELAEVNENLKAAKSILDKIDIADPVEEQKVEVVDEAMDIAIVDDAADIVLDEIPVEAAPEKVAEVEEAKVIVEKPTSAKKKSILGRKIIL